MVKVKIGLLESIQCKKGRVRIMGRGYCEQKIDQIGKSSFNGECFNKPNGYGEG